MAMHRHDVLVIGAGNGGLATAARLLRRGCTDVGLVEPSGRTDGGFRLYSGGDGEKLLLIRRMKPLGFSLDEMAQLLAAVAQPEGGGGPADLEVVAALLDEAHARREQLAAKLRMADEFIQLLEARATS